MRQVGRRGAVDRFGRETVALDSPTADARPWQRMERCVPEAVLLKTSGR